MDILQVDNNRLKVLLTKKDLERYNLTLNSFMSFKIYNNPIILDIITFMYNNISFFKSNNKNILIDTFLLKNSEIIIFIKFVRIIF